MDGGFNGRESRSYDISLEIDLDWASRKQLVKEMGFRLLLRPMGNNNWNKQRGRVGD